jgi:hypothetical protein
VAVGVFDGVGEIVGVGVFVGVFVIVGVLVLVGVGVGVRVAVGGVPHVIESDSGAPGVPGDVPSECFVEGFSRRLVAPFVSWIIVIDPNPFTPGHWKSNVAIRPV